MAYFTSKLGKTFYIKKGRKGLTPIIGCHGGPGGTHNSIAPLLELATDRQIVVYDQIGSGKSSMTKQRDWTIETFCKNLDDLANHLGYEEFILYGSSWGGTLILEYFKRYPKKVKGLIFHSSLISSPIWVKDAQRLISKLPKKHIEVIKCCEKVGATDSKVYKEAITAYYKKHVCRDPKAYLPSKKRKPKSNEELYMYMWGPSEFCPTGTLKKYDGTKLLKKINIPTMFMSGQYDEATPEAAKSFAKKVKGAQFKVIKGCSHSSFRENKKLTKSIISNFLNSF
jgi:proline iminopeptidase